MRRRHTFSSKKVSVLPISDVLEYESVDSEDCVIVPGGGHKYGPVAGVLEEKRLDPQYPALLSELRERGFRKPIHVHPHENRITDGHHRIAAAVELGYSFIPVRSNEGCADDSGDWGMDL